MPDVFAGVRPDGDDRRHEQVVALALGAQAVVPERAVADADVEQVEFGVVGHRIPRRAAAALLPVLVAMPGLADHRDGVALVAPGRVAGDGEETPGLLSGRGVIRGDIAADAEFGAAVADDDLALDDARRPGDRVVALVVDDGIDRPDLLAGPGVERFEAPVIDADIDPALPYGDAAVRRIATAAALNAAIDLGVVFPQQLAVGRVERIDHAVGARRVEHAIDDDRGRLDDAIELILELPGEAELIDVPVVHPGQRREALLAVGAAMCHPVAGFLVGGAQPRCIDRRRLPGGAGQRRDE